MPHDFIVAIPARHDATRLPGKPLRLLAGEPLVLHVARRALAAGAREAWVATDDQRIVDALAGSGVRVAMTATTHASGTDRLAECARIAGWSDDTIVVNLQGDEPFAPASGIRAVAETLAASGAEMATLATPIDDTDALFDPDTVKLVRDADGYALYFSRAPIPWLRDLFAPLPAGAAPAAMPSYRLPEGDSTCLRHIGIYAYRVGFLRRFAAMPPGRLERLESLEQLRALEAGIRIAVELAPEPFPPGVDTPGDLARAEARMAGNDA
ncbi:MAG TPA: 3-deoxy-manno-octulosonate cytidylyltransferase [Xanthomonadaceae bacterium]|nr:3-deoxy-manno-octulosonate cytidylyltransferase [Xanthomonadaceae bacterium]